MEELHLQIFRSSLTRLGNDVVSPHPQYFPSSKFREKLFCANLHKSFSFLQPILNFEKFYGLVINVGSKPFLRECKKFIFGLQILLIIFIPLFLNVLNVDILIALSYQRYLFLLMILRFECFSLFNQNTFIFFSFFLKILHIIQVLICSILIFCIFLLEFEWD